MTYPIAYLLLGAYCALRAGYNDYVAFEHHPWHYAQDFQALYERLTRRKLCSYTPSHDTFSRAFGMLAPGQFRDAFKQWLKALFELVEQHIGIDGKAMRCVKKLAPEARAHAVSAYYPAIRAALDQVFISEKDYEITAIPERLALLDLKGCTVTTDAIGTQVEIVQYLRTQQADYILCVKSNQRAIACIVDPMRFAEAECYGSLNRWQGLPSVLKVTRGREEKKHGQRAQEVNYYICSRTDCEGICQTIRAHGSIENGLHYRLDVLLGEDNSTRRMGNAAQNINIISKMALFFLQRQQEHGKLSLLKVQQMNAAMKPSQLIAALDF